MTYTCAEIYDTLADDYDTHFQDDVSLAENEAIFQWLRPKSNGTICDMGCGTGLLLEYLNIPPEQYVGVDVSQEMLNHARNKFPQHNFIHADIQGSVPLHDHQFNTILMLFGTLSYCNAPYAVVDEIERLLQPGGIFFGMLCADAYQKRPTHIINNCKQDDIYFQTYNYEETSKMFQRFGDVEIFGFSPVDLNGTDDITSDIMVKSITTDTIEMQDRYFLVVTGHA